MATIGSSGWRVHPTEDMNMASTSAAVSTSSYGGIHLPRLSSTQKKSEPSPSMETAYWKDKRKKAGLPNLETVTDQKIEEDKYKQFLKDQAAYVEQNFHQVECVKFVPKPNQTPKAKNNKELKCQCGEILSLHSWGRSFREPGVIEKHVHEDFFELTKRPTDVPPSVIPKVEWHAEESFLTKPTRTFGKMNFNVETACGKKPAKFLRLSSKDSVDACLEYMENYWHIMKPNPPNLVISVVGGAKNFRLDGEMRDTFSNGIIKAAKTTNAWLITSGFNMGVMKSVGQAVREGQAFQWDNDRMTHLLRCIAIAPWGYVYNRRDLEGKEKKGKMNAFYRASNMILHGQPVSLNPDHTHFVFVDDGFRNRYGGVADFRARFERKLCTPTTENGYGIPVVMIVMEGGPDAIQDVLHSLEQGIPVVVCTGTGRAADFLTFAHKFTFKDRNGKRSMHERQKKTLEDRIAAAFSKNWKDKAAAELEKVMTRIQGCMDRSDLMIFFDLRREEDLDVAILSVLTKAETASGTRHRLNQLDLALTWNRADIAQSEIFREDVNWDMKDLYDIMDKALKEDKMSFVRLLLNQGVSMKEYLTVERLESLYNYIPTHGYLHMVLKRQLKKAEYNTTDIAKFLERMLDRYDDNRCDVNGSKGPNGQRKSLGGSLKETTTDTDAEDDLQQYQRPYKQLLIWAVLLNRFEMAKFFWEMGDEPITSALSASSLCSLMHKIIPKYLMSVRQDFLVMRKMFEELATNVLDECHTVDPEKAVMLVERKSPTWSRLTCLQIAAAANNQLFVASVACQNSVNNVWKSGILAGWQQIFLCSLFPFLIMPLIHVVDMGGKHFGKRQKFLTFITAPITKFCFHMMSYMIFLGLYTYMLLVDFQQYPSPLEIILMLWILSFVFGEIHTFICFPSATFRGKIRDWFSFLNRLEMINYLLSFIGFLLRVDSDYYVAAKTIYCINAVIFYIRIIKVYIVNSHLGPKLYMIFRMVEELMMFMVVLVVFLLAYGVCSQGLLYKKREPSFEIVKDIIQFPYWQLYGEIFLEEIQTDTDCIERLGNGSSIPPYLNTCRESNWLVYIMLGLYLLVGNVLLLNLLIAIFSHVFNMVEENSIQIWKYQMYFLVMEFQTKAKVPPPLSVLHHVYILGRFVARSVCCKKKKKTEQFSQHHLSYLALFEKEMMANYLRRVKFESMDSMQRRFTKLSKRIDMLHKIIEDRHVEDELAMQASLKLGDGLKILSAANHLSQDLKEIPPLPESEPSPPPAATTAEESPFYSPLKAMALSLLEKDESDGDHRRDPPEEVPGLNGAVPAQKGSRGGAVTLASLMEEPEEEEMKKKRSSKKKKKKEKRQKSKDRDSRESSPEKKVLNINFSATDLKPVQDKHISDENNDPSEAGATRTPPRHRPRSQSPTDPSVFFKRFAPTTIRTLPPPIKRSSADLLAVDMGEEPDVDSDGKEDKRASRSPKRRQSRGKLNMLSHSESRLQEVEESSESHSDDSVSNYLPHPHRGRKGHKRRSPRGVRFARDDQDE